MNDTSMSAQMLSYLLLSTGKKVKVYPLQAYVA